MLKAPSGEEQHSDECTLSERQQIRADLRAMTFEELLKLKDKLGTKVYADTVLNSGAKKSNRQKKGETERTIPKRLNHNQPREESSKRMVPFMGGQSRKRPVEIRDPRFDERSGEYDAKIFKTNYEFLNEIRDKEIKELKSHLNNSTDPEKKAQLKKTIQKLNNKNVEERKWHKKQAMLKEEKNNAKQAKLEGKKPHYLTKGELKAKMLVKQFEELKASGKLEKHLEKRRRKRAAKDRLKFEFE